MAITTKELISNALFEEISNENPRNFNVSDLAQKVHIARSTLYYQFSSMNDVYSYFLNTHFFDKLEQKQGYCELVISIGEFIDGNHLQCVNLMNRVDSDTRHQFLYEKFYNYLINCHSFTASVDNRQTDDFRREIRILAKSLIFQIELWLQDDVNLREFNNNLQQHFKITRHNLIIKRHRHILSRHIKN